MILNRLLGKRDRHVPLGLIAISVDLIADLSGTVGKLSTSVGTIFLASPWFGIFFGTIGLAWALQVWPGIILRFARRTVSDGWKLEALSHEILLVWEKKQHLENFGRKEPYGAEVDRFPSLSDERDLRRKLDRLGVRTAHIRKAAEWDQLLTAAYNHDIKTARQLST